MASLPPGWEWDYDGARWLYRYKPTGHVQYHFPKAGDEFPDYVDVFGPVPELAPEERLESQQQVRRHASSSTTTKCGAFASSVGNKKKKVKKGKEKNGMSAVAQPVSAVWEDMPGEDIDDDDGDGDGDDDDEEKRGDEKFDGDGVFQPESFMFLGPGTYTDVSPLVEEEEEAAKRTVVGVVGAENAVRDEDDDDGRHHHQEGAAVSPVMSPNTTPVATKSQPASEGGETQQFPPAQDSIPTTLPTTEIEQDNSNNIAAPVVDDGDPDMELFELSAETAVAMQQQQQQQRPFDPVGVLPEMPTEDTAPARIERCPDPVEMADNSILAPIETEVPDGASKLSEKSSPAVERRARGDGAPRGQRQRKESHLPAQKVLPTQRVDLEQVRRIRDQQIQEKRAQQQRLIAEKLQQARQALNEARSISDAGLSSGGSMAPSSGHSSPRSARTPDHGSAPRHSFDQVGMAAALAAPDAMQMPPPLPPKITEEDWQAMQTVRAMGMDTLEHFRNEYQNRMQNRSLSHVPSLLKPGRKIPDSGDRVLHAHPSPQTVRYPSILRPGGPSTTRSDQLESASEGPSPTSTPDSMRGAQRSVHEHDPPHHGEADHERHAARAVTTLPYPEVFPGEIRPASRRDFAMEGHPVPPQNNHHPARPDSPMPALQNGEQQFEDVPSSQQVNSSDHPAQTLQRRQSQSHGSVTDTSDSAEILDAKIASRPAQPPQVISIQRRPSQQNGSLSRSRAESESSILPPVSHPANESRRRSAGPSVHGFDAIPTPGARRPMRNSRGLEPSPAFSQPMTPEPHLMRDANQEPGSNPNDHPFAQSPAPRVNQGEGYPRNISMPMHHQHINAMQLPTQEQVWRAPYPEDSGPIEHPHGGLQRSHSLNSSGRTFGQSTRWQDHQRQVTQTPSRAAPLPAQSLTCIEENFQEYGELSRYPVVQQKRHSLPGGPMRQQPYQSADQQRVQQSQGQPQQAPRQQTPYQPMQQSQGPVCQSQQYPRPTMRAGVGHMMPDQQYASQSQVNLHRLITSQPQGPLPLHHQGARPNPMPNQGFQAPPPMSQPAQMRPQGPVPPQNPLPPYYQSANPHFQKTASWKPPTSVNSPRPLRPISGPPLQTPLSPTTKEKGQGWTKWFRSSKSNLQSPTAASQPNYPPVDIPPPFQGPVRSMTYSVGDSPQPGGWQLGRPSAHPAHQQGFQAPVTASPMVGRPAPDSGSPRSISPISGRSSVRPSFDSQFSTHQEQDTSKRQHNTLHKRPPPTAISDSSSVHSFRAQPTPQPSPAPAPHHGGMAHGRDARLFSHQNQTPENNFQVVSRIVDLPVRQQQSQPQHQHQYQPQPQHHFQQPQPQQQPRRYSTPSQSDEHSMPAPLYTKSMMPLRPNVVTSEAVDRRLIRQP